MKHRALSLEDFDCHKQHKRTYFQNRRKPIALSEEKASGIIIGIHISLGIFLIFSLLA